MKSSEATSYKLIERPIYGSSRVGIDARQGVAGTRQVVAGTRQVVAGNTPLELIGYTAPTSEILTNVLGLKQYEFTNLPIGIGMGNVRAIISDCKNSETAKLYTVNNTAEIQNINNTRYN
ncbi:MAG: hypothetical protein WCP69_09890 [Bacteroidota bacterium]